MDIYTKAATSVVIVLLQQLHWGGPGPHVNFALNCGWDGLLGYILVRVWLA
jgi:hypothetical protein